MSSKVFVPYYLWEDFHSGMWRKLTPTSEKRFLKLAIQFTGDHIKYGSAMREVIHEWKFTMLNSLTNPSVNRRAFLGHCAVQYKINCPEYVTRLAWKELTDNQRHLADKVAQETIDEWIANYERKNRKIYHRLGTQMLLQWDSR